VEPERLGRIAAGLSRLAEPVVLPAHPRTAAVLRDGRIRLAPNVEVRDPMGYLAFASAASQARVIATDSGGLQKEAYWYHVPCVTLRPSTEWVDTVEFGANVLVGDDPDAIEAAVRTAVFPDETPPLYGDGRAAERIAAALLTL
jgi:UDP-N-acetylglucosamine 2-epimerase